LLEDAVIDRAVLGRILDFSGLTDKFKKFEKPIDEK